MLGMSSSNEDAGGSFDMVEEVWWSGGKVYGNEGGVWCDDEMDYVTLPGCLW
jgi:hypothetical protein